MTKATTPPLRRTVKKWLEVANENVVARRMAAAKFKLGDLGQQGGVGLRALYISGPPGVGKTHSIVEQERVWRQRGVEPIRFRPTNVRDLIDHFAVAGGRAPLIMEEADIIFRSKAMFEVLKQATDPATPDLIHRFEKIDGEKVEVSINLNVPIIVSTNMDLSGDIGWDKDLLADRDALFDRSRPIVIPDDPIALWEWSIYLALTSHLTMNVMLRNPKGGKPIEQANPLAVQAQALDWFTDNLNRLAVISPRTLKHVAHFMGRAHRGDMPASILDEELAGLLGPARAEPVALPRKADWGTLMRTMPKSVPSSSLAVAA